MSGAKHVVLKEISTPSGMRDRHVSGLVRGERRLLALISP
jgi:hypothetical protein